MEDFPLIWHLASVPPHNNNNQYKDSSSMDRRSQAFSDKLQRCSSILNMKGGKLKATTMDINQVNLSLFAWETRRWGIHGMWMKNGNSWAVLLFDTRSLYCQFQINLEMIVKDVSRSFFVCLFFTVAPGYYMAALVLSGIFPRDRPTPIGNYSGDPKT